MSCIIIYVHDPMCSWCWGFEPVRHQLFTKLSTRVNIQCLVGGLAPDSNQPMPENMRSFLQQTWRKIEQTIPGVTFNHDFWKNCSPRRSTYPANRAVIAARAQGAQYDAAMTLAIQQAYYQQARNPSDNSTLIELADEIDLDVELFSKALVSKDIQRALEKEIQLTRAIGVNSFPSIVIKKQDSIYPIELDYLKVNSMLDKIELLMQS